MGNSPFRIEPTPVGQAGRSAPLRNQAGICSAG